MISAPSISLHARIDVQTGEMSIMHVVLTSEPTADRIMVTTIIVKSCTCLHAATSLFVGVAAHRRSCCGMVDVTLGAMTSPVTIICLNLFVCCRCGEPHCERYPRTSVVPHYPVNSMSYTEATAVASNHNILSACVYGCAHEGTGPLYQYVVETRRALRTIL